MDFLKRGVIMEINHGLVVKTENGDIVHFVGYDEQPTLEDAENLYHELNHDESFGLAKIIDSLSIEVADEETVSIFRNYVEGQI